MNTTRPQPRRRRAAAFILLEVILAIMLFGIASVGLTTALQQIGLGAVRSAEEMRMQRILETLLTEASKAAEFEPGEVGLGPDEKEVYYTRVIEELELENMDGQPLQRMFRVAIRAEWDDSRGGGERVAEMIRYEPLYQNIQ